MSRIATLFVGLLLLQALSFAQSTGEMLFTSHCISCHAGDLSGHTNFGKKASIPDLKASFVQNQSDKELFDSIGRGVGHKEYPHGFLSRGLTTSQVNDLIKYIRSMSTVKK